MKKNDPTIVYLSDCLASARSWVARSAMLKKAGAMKNKDRKQLEEE